uniref:Ground-like domain-containing protein n=1 Tax=Meloidogyne floridensis TaxID=298350 RepID=A0A915NF57_9BILA
MYSSKFLLFLYLFIKQSSISNQNNSEIKKNKSVHNLFNSAEQIFRRWKRSGFPMVAPPLIFQPVQSPQSFQEPQPVGNDYNNQPEQPQYQESNQQTYQEQPQQNFQEQPQQTFQEQPQQTFQEQPQETVQEQPQQTFQEQPQEQPQPQQEPETQPQQEPQTQELFQPEPAGETPLAFPPPSPENQEPPPPPPQPEEQPFEPPITTIPPPQEVEPIQPPTIEPPSPPPPEITSPPSTTLPTPTTESAAAICARNGLLRYPLPECYTNDDKMMCCNPELEDTMKDAYKTLIREKGNSTFHRCNLQMMANKIQEMSEAKFKTNFEVITGISDFASKSHFFQNYICKIHREGRVILVYATPKHDRDSIPSNVEGETGIGRISTYPLCKPLNGMC